MQSLADSNYSSDTSVNEVKEEGNPSVNEVKKEEPSTTVIPRRRSSIFRSTYQSEVDNTIQDETNLQALPENYVNKLMQENNQWEELYSTIKQECIQLKNEAQNLTPQPLCLENLPTYENYARKAQDIICQVNIVSELHKHAIAYRIQRRQELEALIKESHKKILKKINS